MKKSRIALAVGALAAIAAQVAPAQTPLTYSSGGSSVTLYGNVDYYAHYMTSSSGSKIIALQDGAYLRSRWGLRGEKDLTTGYKGKFQAEQGLFGTTGGPADTTRMFDRQLWAGLAAPAGEFRVGRQNTAIFYKGGYIDFTARTLGSVVNAFGVPSRYDSDVAYISPRLAGFQAEAHYSPHGTVVDETRNQAVSQAALDWEYGPVRIGWAGIAGKPPMGAAQDNTVIYSNFYANYTYGPGKIYLVGIRSNNNGTVAGTPSGTINNGGSPLSNVGNSLVAGTDAGSNTYYDIYQVSVDYNLYRNFRVGALYGQIKDQSGTGKNATGYAFGTFWEILRDTNFYVIAHEIDNEPNAGFRPSGSAGLTKTFTNPADVNGQRIRGVATGFVYRF